MGKEMIFNQIPSDKKNTIIEAIENYCTLSKQESENGWLLTKISSQESELALSGWQYIRNPDQPLDECDARKLVILIDFMVVAKPDCIEQKWQKNIADVASFLRKRFYSAFGKSAYA